MKSRILLSKAPYPSVPVRCAPVASPVNKFAEIASPVPNYAGPVPKTVSGEIKYEYPGLSLWQATVEDLYKWNLVCSPHVSIEPTIEQSLIIGVEEKPYCSSVSIVWRHEYRNCRGFSKQSPWRYWPKKVVYFDQLKHWQNTDVNRRLLIDFFSPAT